MVYECILIITKFDKAGAFPTSGQLPRCDVTPHEADCNQFLEGQGDLVMMEKKMEITI